MTEVAALLRYLIASLAGLVLTGAMFFFLRTLVTAHFDPAAFKPVARIEFTCLRRDSEVQSRREDKPELIMRPQAPSTTTMVTTTGAASGGAVATGPLAASSVGAVGTGALVSTAASVYTGGRSLQKMAVSGYGTDRDAMPLVRIEPEYPLLAAERGIEGWVLLRFNITPLGTVKNAVVVDSNPKGIFEEAALRAVARWKYNPKIDAGAAVERRGIQVVLRFQLR